MRKTPGVIRKLDEQGRILLPLEMRRSLELQCGDQVEMVQDGSAVILRKFQPSCVFCGGTEQMVSYEGRHICGRCMMNLRKG